MCSRRAIAVLVCPWAEQFVRVPRVTAAPGPAQQHPESHKLLLHPVVQIPLDTTALVVHHVHHSRPADGELFYTLLQRLLPARPQEVPGQLPFEGSDHEEPLHTEEQREQTAEGGRRERARMVEIGDRPGVHEEGAVTGAYRRGRHHHGPEQSERPPRRETEQLEHGRAASDDESDPESRHSTHHCVHDQ